MPDDQEKQYDCFLISFEWRELLWEWQSEGFFESECAGMLHSCGIPADACNFKVAVRERKE